MEEKAMEIINEDGKKIIKAIPESLVSEYEAIGWKIVDKDKPAKIESKPLVKDSKLND